LRLTLPSLLAFLTMAPCGCAAAASTADQTSAKRTRPPRADLSLLSVAASFASAEEGRFDLVFQFDRPDWKPNEVKAVAMTWEAWLDQRLFASGKSTLPALPVHGSGVELLRLSLPVVYRHLEYRPGPTQVHLRLRGSLELQRGSARWRREFERAQRLTTDGAPLPASGLGGER
jgi:hypothetical protein